jgi:hypothetical protein
MKPTEQQPIGHLIAPSGPVPAAFTVDAPLSIRERAFDLYVPPFRFQAGYVFDGASRMVADQGGFGGEMEDAIAARVRGWGRIGSIKPDPEALQDEVGAMLAEALTEFWNRRPIQLQGEASPQGAMLDAEAARSARIHEAQPNGQDESDEHLLRKAAEALTESDVYTLIGHAEFLRLQGKEDMPRFFLDLAERIARVRGDNAGADRCAALLQRIGRGK